MKKITLLLFCCASLFASAQSGITWNMGMNIATSASGNDHPRVVMNAAGNPLVIWGNANRAMFSRWNGTAFTAPVMVNPMTMTIAHASFMGPDIASQGDTIYVVFKQTPEVDTASHIWIVRSFDGGITFSPAVKVDSPADTLTRFPTVTTDALGNPIVAYMNFNSGFGNAQWAVATSSDFGNTFTTSVQASGWSSGTSTVCDCCPGSIVREGNIVATLYRDNNSNIRDSWVGLSTNAGNTFTSGWNIDQNNWMIMSCPGTGPDGVIVGDSLYSVFMNSASGMGRVYRSVSSISAGAAQPSQLLTGSITGLTTQNFPRIAQSGNAMAMVWKQSVSGSDQLPLYFTNNLTNGLPAAYDTVDLANITNADVALSFGNICVVWEDDNSGTVKFRSGTFTPVITSVNNISENHFSFFPNPATEKISVSGFPFPESFEIYNALGMKILAEQLFTAGPKAESDIDISKLEAGVYFIQLRGNDKIFTLKLVKL